MHDYHVHSSYSDGEILDLMAAAAADIGLDGVGFADHCIVSDRDSPREHRDRFGFNLDRTYKRRRTAIAALRTEYDLRVFDAVEMDYHPRDEGAIAEFLADAEFDYAIGSVHEIAGHNVHSDYFDGRTATQQREAVAEYFEKLVALIDSDLFDVAAHVDIVERNPALRGYASPEDYERVAAALADSDTITELNAGRVNREYGEFHPAPAFLATLAEYGVPVTVGSDAHRPADLRERHPTLRERLDDSAVDVVDLDV
jgi:histidinol-phosphatase (PHP family)